MSSSSLYQGILTETHFVVCSLGKASKDVAQSRRLLALAEIYAGGRRTDAARVGQKNKIIRRWAKRGTRPSAQKDQRTTSAYIFGAICPALGVGAALVLPRCNTQAMQWHLDEVASQVSKGAHAILILDQAG